MPLLLKSTTIFNSSATEQDALLAFKDGITSDPTGVLTTNWSADTPVCSWTGVSCGVRHHRVTALNLSGLNLQGSIAPRLGNLTFLQSLDISSNRFAGDVPSWIGALPRLRHLHLNNNFFSGEIPLPLFNLSKLQTLNMTNNSLQGNIPEHIRNLVSLATLNLAGNELTGPLPSGLFGNISMLEEIDMSSNGLSGRLPNDICKSGNAQILRHLNLGINMLDGQIPAGMSNCAKLESLDLSVNQFRGNIPTQIGNLTMLRDLIIHVNHLEGLEYLHHGHTNTVVHCDIKPSNVLLNADMIAHVSDFGIAKLLNHGEAEVQTRSMATIGYAAPEFGEGRISTRGDVYSYGILLLEMFTSKRPTDEMVDANLSIKAWVDKALQENRISQVMAPGLISREDEQFSAKLQSVSSIFELAMKCLAISPQERINMVEVVVALQKIKVTVPRRSRRTIAANGVWW